MAGVDFVEIRKSGSAATDGLYERCAFSGLPHSMAVQYADPMSPAWFCIANGCALYRSHPSKFGPEWIGRWVIKAAKGFTRFRSLDNSSNLPPVCDGGNTWEPFAGKQAAPTGHCLVVKHHTGGPVHEHPPYWPDECPPADVAMMQLTSAKTLNGLDPAIPCCIRPGYTCRDTELEAQARSLFANGGARSFKVLRFDAVINAPMMSIFSSVRRANASQAGSKPHPRGMAVAWNSTPKPCQDMHLWV